MKAQPKASHFVNGDWLEDTAGAPIEVIYPGTGETIARLHAATPAVLEAAIAGAVAAQAAWGRRRPVEKSGSNFVLDVDTVVIAIGQGPNPLVQNTTPGMQTNKHGNIVADDDGRTTKEGVFAGGDIVTGAATVILAMGAGKEAARAIDAAIKAKEQ